MGTLVHVDQIRNVQLETCGNNNSKIESDGANNDSNTSSNLNSIINMTLGGYPSIQFLSLTVQ